MPHAKINSLLPYSALHFMPCRKCFIQTPGCWREVCLRGGLLQAPGQGWLLALLVLGGRKYSIHQLQDCWQLPALAEAAHRLFSWPPCTPPVMHQYMGASKSSPCFLQDILRAYYWKHNRETDHYSKKLAGGKTPYWLHIAICWKKGKKVLFHLCDLVNKMQFVKPDSESGWYSGSAG